MGCEDCKFSAGLEHAQAIYAENEQTLRSNHQTPTRVFNQHLGFLFQSQETIRELVEARKECDGAECKVEKRIIELALKESGNDFLQGIYEQGKNK